MEEKLLPAEEQGAGKNLPFRTKADLNSRSEAKTFAAFDLSKLKGKGTFGSEEKLKSQKLIDQLFKEGKSVSQSGFTLVYCITPLTTFYPAQAGFVTPKRSFKHAVDRNRIKRLMREVYRKNKFTLYEKLVERKQQLAVMCVYKGKDMPDYEKAEKSVVGCMNRILK